MNMLRFAAVAMTALLLAGCAARYPEPIRTDATDLVELRDALRNADTLEGRPARWGGVIAEVENSQQRTRIEMVAMQLNNFGRPQVNDRSPGRFVVYLDEFVDPEIYKQGRLLTALGTFRGLEEGQIGEFAYNYPVLEASGVELWRPQENRQPQPIYYDPWFRHHMYGPGPYMHPYYYYPYRRVIPAQPAPPRAQPAPARQPQGTDRPRQQQH